MTDQRERNLEVLRQLVSRWNAGDTDAFLALHSEDVEMITDPEWPDPSTAGKAALADYAQEWRSAWDAVEMVLEPIAADDDKVACRGAWDSRGAASGVSGMLAFGILFTFRDGLIVQHHWFRDPEDARAAVAPDA